jgi:hypothetical protein
MLVTGNPNTRSFYFQLTEKNFSFDRKKKEVRRKKVKGKKIK